jgi:hypothetical protein
MKAKRVKVVINLARTVIFADAMVSPDVRYRATLPLDHSHLHQIRHAL